MSRVIELKSSATATLSTVINPFLFVQAWRMSVGQLRVRFRNTDQTTQSVESVTSERYALPFSGEWLVANGGVTKQASHSWEFPNQRYAYDFVKAADLLVGRSGGKRRTLADYSAFGQPVVAPANGIVVSALEGQRDYPFPGTGAVDMWCRDIRGNHILIQHHQDEFSLLAHLRRGSILVEVGDSVRVGQKIGECGNSGHSTQPHLHFHVQDTASFYTAASRIIQWDNLFQNGKVIEDGACLTRNDRVADASGKIN